MKSIEDFKRDYIAMGKYLDENSLEETAKTVIEKDYAHIKNDCELFIKTHVFLENDDTLTLDDFKKDLEVLKNEFRSYSEAKRKMVEQGAKLKNLVQAKYIHIKDEVEEYLMREMAKNIIGSLLREEGGHCGNKDCEACNQVFGEKQENTDNVVDFPNGSVH